MSKISICLIGLFTIVSACNNHKVKKEDVVRRFPLTYVHDETAEKMIEHLTGCTAGCSDPDFIDISVKKEKEIKDFFKEWDDFEYIDARYTPDDVKLYADRHGVKIDAECAQIDDKATKLLRVERDGKSFYFDLVTICPPPNICDDRCKP